MIFHEFPIISMFGSIRFVMFSSNLTEEVNCLKIQTECTIIFVRDQLPKFHQWYY